MRFSLRSLLGSFGRPEPRHAEGVIALSILMIVVFAIWAGLSSRALSRPDLTPYLDPDVMKLALGGFLVCVCISLLFLCTGVVARSFGWRANWLAQVFAQFWFIESAFFAYLLGPFTDLFAAMALFVGTVLMLALLGPSAARTGVLTYFVLLVAASIAERQGVIPYAPAFVDAPYRDAHLSRFWFWWGIYGACGLVFAVVLFIGTTQRLRRATDLIQRYVPAQLAEKILSGEHVGGASPERRKVTLFFSDVVGFTTAADQMEPEDLASLLNEYLSEMSEIADAYGATVN